MLGTLYVTLQVALLVFLFVVIIKSWKAKNRESKFGRRTMLVVDLMLTLILAFCFYYGDERAAPFHGERYYHVFAVLTAILTLAYWWIKLDRRKYSGAIALLRQTFLGAFFVLAVLVTFSMYEYLLLIWFPLFGFLAAAPLLLVFSVVSQILNEKRSTTHIQFYNTSLLGIAFLFCCEIGLNIISNDTWILIHLLEPTKLF